MSNEGLHQMRLATLGLGDDPRLTPLTRRKARQPPLPKLPQGMTLNLRRRREPTASTFIRNHYTPIVQTAPIALLPFDVLNEIFLYLCSRRSKGKGQAPWCLLLSQVCMRWRQFTFNSQWLWKDCSFVLPSLRNKYSSVRLPMATWTDRVQCYPTSAGITVQAGRPACYRWRLHSFVVGARELTSLKLSFPLSSSTILDQFSYSLSSLKSLHIHVSSLKDVLPEEYRPLMLSLSPIEHLSSTSFAGQGFLHNCKMCDIQIQWDRLRTLTVHEGKIEGDICRRLLYKCRSLEKCSLLGITTWDLEAEDPATYEDFALPKLESLELSFLGTGSALPLLESLLLPNLKSLSLTNIMNDFTARDIARRICTKLERFTLRDSFIDDHLEELLDCMPELQYLEVRSADAELGWNVFEAMYRDTPEELKASKDDPPLRLALDHLEELHFIETAEPWNPCSREESDELEAMEADEYLVKMVESRLTEPKLKKLCVHYTHRRMDENYRLDLERMVTKGLDVRIVDAGDM